MTRDDVCGDSNQRGQAIRFDGEIACRREMRSSKLLSRLGGMSAWLFPRTVVSLQNSSGCLDVMCGCPGEDS